MSSGIWTTNALFWNACSENTLAVGLLHHRLLRFILKPFQLHSFRKLITKKHLQNVENYKKEIRNRYFSPVLAYRYYIVTAVTPALERSP